MRAILYAAALAFIATQANATASTCQRYQSKCTGQKCYALAEGLREDVRNALAAQQMERIDYAIENGHAIATVDPEAKMHETYTSEFKFVAEEVGKSALENRTETGVTKERVIIEKPSGFYVHYLLHTDNSLNDVPLGEPYSAYFGWCDLPPEITPTPAQPEVPAAPPAAPVNP